MKSRSTLIFLFFSLFAFSYFWIESPWMSFSQAETKQRSDANYAFQSLKSEYPDEWVRAQVEMRTEIGDTIPRYRVSYQLDEFRKYQSASRSKIQRLDWIERGPGNVPGRTRSVVVDPRDGANDTWLAGSVSGGIWKTTDGGNNWVSMTDDFPQLAISTMALAQSNPTVVYAGTGETGFGNLGAVAGNGILKSTDFGESWTQLSSTTRDNGFSGVSRLIVDPNDENVVVAATTSGIYRSTNGGDSFQHVFQTGNIQDLDADPSNFSRLYATQNGLGVLRSTDGGVTWTNTGASFVDGRRFELAVSRSAPSTVYVAAEVSGASGNSSALYVSNDFGESFAPVGGNSLPPAGWLENQGWYDNVIMVHPFKENIVYVGGVDLFRIVVLDNGETTTSVKSVVQENTSSFLSFINFGGQYLGGAMSLGTENGAIGVSDDDFVSVEIRFGPGVSQKAHRFSAPDGLGVPASEYRFEDYSDVPFEVWDITNNRQLMVSYRDRLNDGQFNLLPRIDANLGREYIFVQAIDYDPDNPTTQVTSAGGHTFKQIYFMWPILTSGATWEPGDLPNSTLRINYGDIFSPFWSHINVSSDDALHVDQQFLEPIILDEAAETFEFINGNDGGVGQSVDGNTWFTKSGGYNTTQFYGADKQPGASKYVAGAQDNGTWVSPDDPVSTTTWEREIGGDGFESIWSQTDPMLVMGASQNNGGSGGLSRSRNGGRTFTGMVGMSDRGSGNAPFVTRLDRSRQDGELVFTTGVSGIWKTDNWGSNWQLYNIPAADWGTSSFCQARIGLADPQIVWAICSGNLQLSEDGGETFRRVGLPTEVSNLRVTKLTTHPNDPETVFLTYSVADNPKIFRSEDLGQNWNELSGFGSADESSNGFPDVAVLSLLVLPHDDDTIWAGTEIGIFVSENNGSSWSYSDFGLPAVAVWDMKTSEDQIVTATYGRGLWTLTMPELLNTPPPAVSLPPQFVDFTHNADGNIAAVNPRTDFDSLQVWVSETSYHTVSNIGSAQADISFALPLSISGQVPIRVVGFKDGRGYKSMVIRSTVTVGTSAEIEIPDVKEFAISGNYPNPFSDKTTIQFSIPEEANVAISVYSMDGRRVEDLGLRKFERGRHNIEWDSSTLASGKYLIVLKKDDRQISRMVSLAR